MTIPTKYSFAHYLAAKKSIDDRSLNSHVWKTMVKRLKKSSFSGPMRILEVGSGIGTMIERLLNSELLENAIYTAIEARKENKIHAIERCKHGHQATTIGLLKSLRMIGNC